MDQSHTTGGSKGRTYAFIAFIALLIKYLVPETVQQNAPKEVENALPNKVKGSYLNSHFLC